MSSMGYYILISIVAWLSTLLPPFQFIRSKGRKLPILKLISLLCLLSFLFDLASYFLGSKGVNTYPIGNASMLVQAIILLLIYQDALKISKTLTLLSGFGYGCFFVVNYFWIQTPFLINSYSIAVSSILFIFLSLLYFRVLLKELPETFVHRIPMVWINIAVLIYYSGNLFLFMLYNYLMSGVWLLHNILVLVMNILFFVSIWQSQRKTTSTSF